MHEEVVHHHRWRIAALLGIGVLVNYFDRVNLSVAHRALFQTFNMSDVTYGYLSGAYNWTYAACQLPIGLLLDRFGVRRIGRISTLIWGLASFCAALTPNVAGFFAARLLLGVGEAPTFPANAKAIGLWFPDREKGSATAIFDAAAKFASALGVPLLGLLLIRIGWRWSFAATGLLSLAYFALFTRVYRDPPATQQDPELPTAGASTGTGAESQNLSEALFENPSPKPSLPSLLRQRKVVGLALGMGAYNYVFYLLITWLPSYLSFALHIDLLHSFLYTGVPWLFATGTDLAAGLGSDALIRRGWNADRVRRIILLCGTACGLGILGAAHAGSPSSALLWISLSIGGLSAAAPIGWALPSIIAPRESVGTVGGIVNFSNQISGSPHPLPPATSSTPPTPTPGRSGSPAYTSSSVSRLTSSCSAA